MRRVVTYSGKFTFQRIRANFLDLHRYSVDQLA
jgi:hypothetical protein